MTITKKIKYKSIDKLNNISTLSINLQISNNSYTQMYCVHRALKNQLNNNRVRNANTKTRSEVRGGGKKPWKQKGTGRARAGSNRSPLWRGGGVIFGPKNKIYKSKINKKEKKLAISTLLYNKSQNTIIIDNITTNNNIPNTKNVLNTLNKLDLNIKKYNKTLIIIEEKTNVMYMSFRNLPNIKLIERKNINILSLLEANTILITKQAINRLNNT
uniref:Large ribosomal subunit protein uL4c n=1 Tax=Chondria tumulosa TaxID=2740715 RepID=A0A896ST39_9FLOR|nr:ribosomal protein L4 [Chondria tumulosa]QSD57143.1 ribosomal protein L4 [Chondria tumulosa]